MSQKKDLFISHASEDKDSFVRPLANLLKEYGIDVWYDEFELRIGVSVSRSIDKGIAGSRFGLLVLSKSFFNKNWTEYELKSLNAFEIENGNVLLPIWKDVTFKEVREFSPYLSDKFALKSEEGIESIAIKIIEIIKPDLFEDIHKKLMIHESIKNGEKKKMAVKELKPGPIRHPKLNDNLISRIRLIRSSLWLCYPHSMKFWLDGFQRDLNIESEIRFWEHVSTCFLEIILQQDIEKSYLGKEGEIHRDLFNLLFSIAQPDDNSNSKFESDFVEKVKSIYSYKMPIYDIEESSFFENFD